MCFHDVLCGGGMPHRAFLRVCYGCRAYIPLHDGRGKGSGHSTHIRSLSGLADLNPKDSDVYRNNAGGLDSTPSESHVPI